MALLPPEDLTQEANQQSEQRDLPAAYRNPWSTLGANLLAVVADTRLRAQELLRLNAQGRLGRPAWWPVDLAPLFWPLVLALALALVLVLGTQLATAWRRSPPAPAPDSLSAVEQTLPPAERSVEPAPTAAASPAENPPENSAEKPVPFAAPVPEPVAPPEPLDPLMELVQRPDADRLLIGAAASVDQLTLMLQVAPAFAALPSAAQQRYADQWQGWARELGYDNLELRDSRAGLLARDALVGSGMIVLNELSRP
jgi:hypothetical protein